MIDEKVLIERLEEHSFSLVIDWEKGKYLRKDKAIEIVKDLASEHNNGFCKWRLIDEEANVYDTTCRNPHILLEGSPADNNYEFCPYCGKEIKVADEPKKPSDTWKQQTMSRFERVE